MNRARLEAFTDGMLAIFITIMVLDLRPPHEASWQAVSVVLPTFLTYVLSFIYLAIYWNNHHHLLHMAQHIDGAIMWANINLLFWLSLVPFLTGWMGATNFDKLPTTVYGIDLLLCGLAFLLLIRTIIRSQGPNSALKASLGTDWKGKLSPVVYISGIAFSMFLPWVGEGFYLLGAVMWMVPDRRIEKRVIPPSHGASS